MASTPRSKIPTRYRSHEHLSQRPTDKSSPRPPEPQSKVRAYIREMKENDKIGSTSAKSKNRQASAISLEDLYQVSEGNSLSPETAKKELRTTLRIIKEKEMTILKLQQACHDLTLKYADAENTIDQLRFGVLPGGMRRAKSEFNVAKPVEMKDQATETKVEVLSECCSSWMEKVQNWKTDSIFNASADADSGFRGSELETRSKKTSYLGQTADSKPGTSKMEPQTLHTVGTNTDEQNSRQLPIIKSQSYHDINYTFSSVSIRSGSHDRSLENAHNQSHRRASTNHFRTLEPLLDEATTLARRVQKKSRKLAKLIQSVDKKV